MPCVRRRVMVRAGLAPGEKCWYRFCCGLSPACLCWRLAIVACLVAATLLDRRQGRKAGAGRRKIRRDRRQPHPLCRRGRGAADRVRARAWRPTPPVPAHAVRPLRPGLPADRARPAGIGLFDAGERRHRPIARTGRDRQALHRNARAGKAAGGRALTGRRRRADPGRGTSRRDFRHRFAGAADASGNRRAPRSRACIYIRSRLWRWVMAYTVAIPTSLRYARPTLEFIFAPQPVPADYMVNGGGMARAEASPFPCDVDRFRGGRSTILAASSSAMARSPCRPAFCSAPPTASSTCASMASRCKDRIEGLDFETVEGLGHMPQFVEPDRVVAFIKRIAERAFAGRASPQPHDNFTEPFG